MAVFKKNRWVGYNNHKTNPKLSQIKDDGAQVSCYHAETHVLLKVPKNLRSRVKLYVARVRGNGQLTMSRPCLHCQQILFGEGVAPHNIWYTDYTGKWISLATS